MSRTSAVPDMVGREDERGALAKSFARTLAARTSHMVLVTGPAGIGKSLILDQFVGSRTTSVFLARTDPLDRGVPFGLFRDGLYRLQQEVDRDPRLNDLVSSCLAELDASSWTSTSPSAPSRVNTIFLSLRGVLAALAASSTDGAVIVALEDLHDADAESTALLYRLARHAVGVPVLTVATTRPGSSKSPIRQFVDRLSRDGRGSFIALQPLDRDQIATMVTSEIGSPVSADLVDAVYRESQGNPFFAKAAMSAWRSQGSLSVGSRGVVSTQRSDPGELSPDLLDRFFIEGDADWRAACALALLGRVSLSDLEIVESVTGLDSEQVTRSFDRLVADGLLVMTSPGSYGFTHALLRSALYGRIGVAETARLHRLAARAMEERRGRGGAFDVFAFATHVYESVSPDDPLLVESALAAAVRATGTAPLVAAEWFGRAIRALADDSMQQTVARVQQTMALLTGQDSVQAMKVGMKALATAPAGLPRAGLALATATAASSSDRLPEALMVLDQELKISPDDLDLAVCRMLILSQMGMADEAAAVYSAVARRAMEAEPGDPFKDGWTYSTLWAYAEQRGLPEDRSTFRRLAHEHAARMPAPAHGGMLLFLNTQVGADPGSFETADAELTLAAELLGRSSNPYSGDDVRVDVPTFGWFRGKWDQTLESVRTNLAFSASGSNRTAAEVARAVGVIILTDRGDYVAAARLAKDLEMGAELGRSLAALALARMARSRGGLPVALQHLERRRTEMLERGTMRMFTLVTEEIVTLLVGGGDLVAAQQAADEAWRVIQPAKSQILEFWGLRSLALAYSDIGACQRAEAIAAREGLPFELARCRLILGELGVNPIDNLRTAIAAFDAIGAKPWRRRAGAALRAKGLAVPRASRRTDELTGTEIEIMGLVQERLTNRQIAGVLKYSEKTIEVYLSRIYAKTETSSRLELVQAIHAGRVSATG